MFVKVNSIGLFGMDSYEVGVEASVDNGMVRFDIVGLPDTAVSESRDRVRSAIKNSGFKFPPSRFTVNLTPADIIITTRRTGGLHCPYKGLLQA